MFAIFIFFSIDNSLSIYNTGSNSNSDQSFARDNRRIIFPSPLKRAIVIKPSIHEAAIYPTNNFQPQQSSPATEFPFSQWSVSKQLAKREREREGKHSRKHSIEAIQFEKNSARCVVRGLTKVPRAHKALRCAHKFKMPMYGTATLPCLCINKMGHKTWRR